MLPPWTEAGNVRNWCSGESGGETGTEAPGKRMLLLNGGAAAAPQFHLCVAVEASEPRVTWLDLSTGARKWYFNVKSDFQWRQVINTLNHYQSQIKVVLWVAALSPFSESGTVPRPSCQLANGYRALAEGLVPTETCHQYCVHTGFWRLQDVPVF